MHLVIRRSSENIDSWEIEDGILIDKWDIQTTKDGNLSLLPKSVYTKTIFYFDIKI